MSKIYEDENGKKWCLYIYCKEGGISLSPFRIYDEGENLKLTMIFNFQFTFAAKKFDNFDYHIYAVEFDETLEKTNEKIRDRNENGRVVCEFSMEISPRKDGIASEQFDNFYVQFDTELTLGGFYSVSLPFIKMRKYFLCNLMKIISAN